MLYILILNNHTTKKNQDRQEFERKNMRIKKQRVLIKKPFSQQ